MQNTDYLLFMLNNEKRGRTKYRFKKIKNQLQKQNPYLDCLPGLVPVPVSQPRVPGYSHRLQCLSGRWRSRRKASGSVPASHSNRWRSNALCRDSETKVNLRFNYIEVSGKTKNYFDLGEQYIFPSDVAFVPKNSTLKGGLTSNYIWSGRENENLLWSLLLINANNWENCVSIPSDLFFAFALDPIAPLHGEKTLWILHWV